MGATHCIWPKVCHGVTKFDYFGSCTGVVFVIDLVGDEGSIVRDETLHFKVDVWWRVQKHHKEFEDVMILWVNSPRV
jgi:hypothetical protein